MNAAWSAWNRRALSEFDQLLRAERALIEEQAQLIKKLQNLAQALTPVDDKRRNDNASTSFGHGAAISAGTRLRIAHLQPSVTTSDSDRGGTQKAQLKGGQTHSAS